MYITDDSSYTKASSIKATSIRLLITKHYSYNLSTTAQVHTYTVQGVNALRFYALLNKQPLEPFCIQNLSIKSK